jgi:hypothetical protein
VISLRRADWRFLLPVRADGFEHLVLVGGPAGLAERLQAAGLARRVSRGPVAARSADALVILADAQVAIDAARPALRSGGVLYLEVDRRRPGRLALTPALVASRLTEAGLSPLETYWVKPGFESAEMFLPLGAPGALEWYLDTIFMAASPLRRVLEPALRALARGGADRFARLAPCFAITASDGDPPADLCSLALPDYLRRPGLHPLLLSSGDPAI